MNKWLRLILEKILPRGIRNEYLDALDEHQGPPLRLILESVAAVAGGYRVQAVASFNKYAFVVELGLVTFCFGTSLLQPAFLIGLGAVLGALSLRDAYTHRNSRDGFDPAAQYYLDSAGDAVTAAVFLLAAEALALRMSPELAFGTPVLYRGAMVCLPLIATLRMVLRHKPDPKSPFEGSHESAVDLYKRTMRLNVMWLAAFNGVIVQNISDDPSSIVDFLRGFLPIATIGIWIALQRDALSRRDKIETLFTDWKKKMKGRWKETLPQGLQKGEPFYRSYAALEILLFVELAGSMAEVLWPWLSGQAPHDGFLRSVASLIGFTTSVLSWKYIKNSNRASARVFQKEIEYVA